MQEKKRKKPLKTSKYQEKHADIQKNRLFDAHRDINVISK